MDVGSPVTAVRGVVVAPFVLSLRGCSLLGARGLFPGLEQADVVVNLQASYLFKELGVRRVMEAEGLEAWGLLHESSLLPAIWRSVGELA